MEALGISKERQNADDAAARARRLAAERVEGSRAQVRERNEKVVRDSVFDSSQSPSSLDDQAATPSKKR